MDGIRALIARHRRGFALVLLCTLAIRAIVPAGWMPVSTAGGVAISVCTGTGAAAMTLAPDGTLHEKAPAQGHDSDHPCAFAGAVPPLELATAPVLLAATGIATVPVVAVRIISVGRGLAAPPPPQTGPPALI